MVEAEPCGNGVSAADLVRSGAQLGKAEAEAEEVPTRSEAGVEGKAAKSERHGLKHMAKRLAKALHLGRSARQWK
ncbi:hypothetical protein GPECTOR_1g116 [Gonium pectorale]|uniref:Uncharacterized protein n=1 Tax=Gonium pectorale TaxID=33097 RepID=A0A150H1W3_GONPE|nr:hypothetical protein GPECTOR_1g116 [Gonium pectorale]|eukprot:KXZ56137.1 hypothetical protein GPECTOR_1g116 [Gonium pectorale]